MIEEFARVWKKMVMAHLKGTIQAFNCGYLGKQ
jgi:hypothetical protein